MKIELIIYLLGVLTGCSFGIAVSLLIDFLTNEEDLKTLVETLKDILKGVDKE